MELLGRQQSKTGITKQLKGGLLWWKFWILLCNYLKCCRVSFEQIKQWMSCILRNPISNTWVNKIVENLSSTWNPYLDSLWRIQMIFIVVLRFTKVVFAFVLLVIQAVKTIPDQHSSQTYYFGLKFILNFKHGSGYCLQRQIHSAPSVVLLTCTRKFYIASRKQWMCTKRVSVFSLIFL